MTSSRKLTMSKRWLFWSGLEPETRIAFLFFVLFVAHGALFGLSDDEAYYWVLAQKPALGYAYHPPVVAWVIALAERSLGWIFGNATPAGLVRLPSVTCAALALWLALRWLREVGVEAPRIRGAAMVLLSFAGLFALSWMMVPDLPLLVGWMFAFRATWQVLCRKAGVGTWIVLGAATALSILSKYSGVFVGASAFASIWLWAPQERRWESRIKGLVSIGLGALVAAVPILIWNAHHEWASILYQIRDRHEGGSLSWVRYLRFWVVEAFAAGPVMIGFAFWLAARALGRSRGEERVFKYCLIWMAPAAVVFGLQPLWADFKPHWAFIAWWPAAIALAWASSAARDSTLWRSGAFRKLARFQIAYGWLLGLTILAACHLPLGNLALRAARGDAADPRLDVTNDLYGWGKLKERLRQIPGNEDLSMPVLGSRYQTASQAYFALGRGAAATMLPRDIKARDEWPDLPVSDSVGPEWPTLLKSVLFVSDNRYDAPPEYKGASCAQVGAVEERRGGLLAKKISIWRCDPSRS